MRKAGGRYIHLTLTFKNPADGELRAAIEKMSKAFGEMMRDRRLRGVVGGYVRTIEVSRKFSTWHPHIHALIRVDEGYFHHENGLYIDKWDWIALWKEYMKLDYDPSVSLRAILPAEINGAATEIAKYVTKPDILIGLPLERLREWLEAVKGWRLWSAGGCLRIDESKIEEEMIHAVDEEKTPDICPVCGQRLVTVDWTYTTYAGYVQSLTVFTWPTSKKHAKRRR